MSYGKACMFLLSVSISTALVLGSLSYYNKTAVECAAVRAQMEMQLTMFMLQFAPKPKASA